MTIDQYVENLKPLVPAFVVQNTIEWSPQDRMYMFLHYIQIQKMEEFKELFLKQKPTKE